MTNFQEDVISRLSRIESNQFSELEYRKDHGVRITKLEQWRWYMGGALVVALAVGKFLIG